MVWFHRRRKWPNLDYDEIKKQAKILVIDDNEFIYQRLFTDDGYSIVKWDDVENLSQLEKDYYDLILLDIQGVGKDHSSEQGLGILKHIREANPTQIIVAYSNADWSLKYQQFFRMADATLAKSSDYVEFKRTVDELLKKRYSIEFYLHKITALLKDGNTDSAKLEELARKAILTQSTQDLEKYLKTGGEKAETAKLILQIAQTGIALLAALC